MGEVCHEVDPLCPFIPLCGGLHMDHSKLLGESQVVQSAFLMSILWIAIISFAMVTIVARVGCILNVGEFPMGLVVMAIGTSVPVSGTYTLILCLVAMSCSLAFATCSL